MIVRIMINSVVALHSNYTSSKNRYCNRFQRKSEHKIMTVRPSNHYIVVGKELLNIAIENLMGSSRGTPSRGTFCSAPLSGSALAILTVRFHAKVQKGLFYVYIVPSVLDVFSLYISCNQEIESSSLRSDFS